MAYLADTNIVARCLLPADPAYPAIHAALDRIDQLGTTVFITAQNLVEFRALATRPLHANGLGLTPTEASVEGSKIEDVFPLLSETPAIFSVWKELVDEYAIVGRQVYDARLVAVMLTYGISHLLTLNPTHFRRFAGITVVEP